MTPQEFETLLEKYERNECSPEEKQLVDDWYEELGKAKPFRATAEIEKLARQRVQSQLRNNIRSSAKHRTKEFSWPSFAMKVAAGLLILFICIFLLYNDTPVFTGDLAIHDEQLDSNNYTTDLKGQRIIHLMDGSKVTLQPGSELTILNKFDKTREVRLTGEGFFEIKRDVEKPFLVYSNEIITKVLGTSFHVKAYQSDKEITVIVKTGKVSVSKQRQKDINHSPMEVILQRNQKAIYDRGENNIVKTLADNPEPVIPQASLTMQYKNAPVSDIFHDLEQAYGVDITFDEELIQYCSLTTTLVNENFHERIEIICKAIRAQYEVTETGVIVKKNKPCNRS